MAKLKRSRGAFKRTDRPKVLALTLTVAVFLLLCLILSVAVGLILGRRAEEYRPKVYNIAFEPYHSGGKTVFAVDAHLFPADGYASSYVSIGITDLSLCLRDQEGKLSYPSEIDLNIEGVLENTEENIQPRTLEKVTNEIHNAGGRACGYFYVTSLFEENRYLRELQMAYEIALVNEAAKSGVDEILLLGPEINENNIGEIEMYVSNMSYAAGDALLGFAVSPQIFAQTQQNVYLAARIRSVCDFVALDLRDLPADVQKPLQDAEGGKSPLESLLEENEYYIKAYGLRILLSAENKSLYDALIKYGVNNLQIVAN